MNSTGKLSFNRKPAANANKRARLPRLPRRIAIPSLSFIMPRRVSEDSENDPPSVPQEHSVQSPTTASCNTRQDGDNAKSFFHSGNPKRDRIRRVELFLLVRILLQYLGRVDRSTFDLARQVLKDCDRKHRSKDSKYATLADAINDRLRDAVGEAHWARAKRIRKRLAVNHRKRKTLEFGLVGLGEKCTL